MESSIQLQPNISPEHGEGYSFACKLDFESTKQGC